MEPLHEQDRLRQVRCREIRPLHHERNLRRDMGDLPSKVHALDQADLANAGEGRWNGLHIDPRRRRQFDQGGSLTYINLDPNNRPDCPAYGPRCLGCGACCPEPGDVDEDQGFDCNHGTPGCDCYQAGYARGKEKAWSEIELVLVSGDHSAGCGCRPCTIIRAGRGDVNPTYPT